MTNNDGPPGAPLNPYSPPAVAIDAGVSFQPVATSTFRSASTLAKAITIIFGIDIVAELVSDVNAAITIEVMGRLMAEAPYTEAELSAIDTRNVALAVVSVPVAILGVVVFCMFMVRANRNARSFGSPMSITPGWAAGYFFVPILSLWKPYQAMKEIWQCSDPDPGAHAFTTRVTPMLGWWWALYITHNIAGRVVWSMHKNLKLPKDFISASWTSIVASGFSIGAALLAIALVRGVARRQDERQVRQQRPAV